MTILDILRYRLYNQHLANPTIQTPSQSVSHLGAVQSQDYASAKWALAQRLQDSTDESIEKAFDDGQILRTHVMRPTWHFVAPNDIRWLLKLTAPRVNALMGYYDRQLGLTKEVLQTTQTILQKTLNNDKALTRDELGIVLKKNNLPNTGQALGHIAMHAELDGVICSGPRKGKQFTYMLLEERVPKTKTLDRDESLAELTKRYFTSHGPATIKDFTWWSGLTVVDAKNGIAMNKAFMTNEIVDGKEYWFAQTMNTNEPMPKAVYLLPNYDENIVAYKDRDIFFNQEYNQHLDARGNMLFHHMIMFEGGIIGLWRRELTKDSVNIESRFFKTLSVQEKHLVQEAFARYGKFLGKTIILS